MTSQSVFRIYAIMAFAIFINAVATQYISDGYLAKNSRKSCCYGDRKLAHGTVLLNDPRQCFQLVCQHGLILPKFIKKKGDKNCCEFNDRLYPDGSQLGSGFCMSLTCEGGSWKPSGKIEECCDHCQVYDDPHLRTFDGYRYDWHGKCNYSVAQSYFSTKPAIGVFSEFSPCYGLASCLRLTTFRDGPHTVVSLDNGAVFQVKVNGFENVVEDEVKPLACEKNKHPVLAWKHKNCVFILGSSRILLLHCPHRLDIWAHPIHSGKLNGLCGHYNNHQNDDFTNREGEIHSLNYWPMAFPYSWLTSEQSHRQCNDPCHECLQETTTDPCKANATHRAFYHKVCTDSLQDRDIEGLQQYIEACAFDMCLIYQSGGDENTSVNWMLNLEESLSVLESLS